LAGWLIEGEILHRDSLGSEQVIRPGQFNLMTAGQGVAHSEEATGAYHGQLHGVQLWVAQPEATRHGSAAFEHHPELPRIELGRSEATILVSTFDGTKSPARAETPVDGCDAVVRTGTTQWPLKPSFEHALVVLEGAVVVDAKTVEAGQLAYLGQGREVLTLHANTTARLLLLGGEPFVEPIVMWWNFVARSRAELDAATRAWNAQDPRFGSGGFAAGANSSGDVFAPLVRRHGGIAPWIVKHVDHIDVADPVAAAGGRTGSS
jgi:redox-sensitive bicupin YhaK (pirin superfamily)